MSVKKLMISPLRSSWGPYSSKRLKRLMCEFSIWFLRFRYLTVEGAPGLWIQKPHTWEGKGDYTSVTRKNSSTGVEGDVVFLGRTSEAPPSPALPLSISAKQVVQFMDNLSSFWARRRFDSFPLLFQYQDCFFTPTGEGLALKLVWILSDLKVQSLSTIYLEASCLPRRQ